MLTNKDKKFIDDIISALTEFKNSNGQITRTVIPPSKKIQEKKNDLLKGMKQSVRDFLTELIKTYPIGKVIPVTGNKTIEDAAWKVRLKMWQNSIRDFKKKGFLDYNSVQRGNSDKQILKEFWFLKNPFEENT